MDEIDEEVRKLLEEMERKCDLAAMLNGTEDSLAQALRDVSKLHERARQAPSLVLSLGCPPSFSTA